MKDHPWYWRIWPLSRVWLRGYLAGHDEAAALCIAMMTRNDSTDLDHADGGGA